MSRRKVSRFGLIFGLERTCLLSVPESETPWAATLNTPECGYRVFVTVNQTDGKGRKQENIVRPRSLFVDADGPDQVAHCERALAAASIIPSAVARTGR
jgi:hypothetical protein